MKSRPLPLGAVLCALAALLSIACVAPRSAEKPDTTVGAFSAGRIVVAPLNLAIRPPAGFAFDTTPVREELVRHFQQLDRPVKVVEPASAVHLWEASLSELSDSGAKPDLASASQRFAQRLAEHSDYDLLVMPSLLLRSARVRGSDAYWDGVKQRLPVGSIAPFGPIDAVEPMGVRASRWSFKGRVAAVSLHVAILTPDGRTVFHGIGGIDVLQEAKLASAGSHSWELVDRTDPLGSPERVSHGVSVAFEHPLREIAAAW
jgi:hypothetical protein